MIKNEKVRRALGSFLKSNSLFLFIYNSYYRMKNRKQFYNRIKENKDVSIFDYKVLAKPIPFYPIETVKDSNYYGHSYWMKKYAEIATFPYSIEHGLYYGNHLPYSSKTPTVKAIMTVSQFREDRIHEILPKMRTVSVGPYIHYAEPLLGKEDIVKIKNKYGKILLYFPQHSTSLVNAISDFQESLENVNCFAEKYNFDSVFVNLFHVDIERFPHYAKLCEEKNFKVVTAGHKFDFNFIARLKSIILLSDYTISNRVGTHTGYCVYLGKPHYIFDDYTPTSPNPTINKNINDIKKFFTKYSPNITKEQFDIVKKYWGLESIKTKEEMVKILM